LASVLRVITEDYLRRSGLDIKLDHGGGQSGDGHVPGRIHPRARADARLLPSSLVSRPLEGEAPTIDLVVGYHKANTSPILRMFLYKIGCCPDSTQN
jgi:LysR family hca operon transcriptional activator